MVNKHSEEEEKNIDIGLYIFEDDISDPITSNFVIFIRNYNYENIYKAEAFSKFIILYLKNYIFILFINSLIIQVN